jgi:hypothetical protein
MKEQEIKTRAMLKAQAAAWLEGWQMGKAYPNSGPADNAYLAKLDSLDKEPELEKVS